MILLFAFVWPAIVLEVWLSAFEAPAAIKEQRHGSGHSRRHHEDGIADGGTRPSDGSAIKQDLAKVSHVARRAEQQNDRHHLRDRSSAQSRSMTQENEPANSKHADELWHDRRNVD